MAAALRACLQGYSQTAPAGVFSPKGLFGAVCKKAPRFRGFAQQDSEELLHVLLDTLQARAAEGNRVRSAPGGQLAQRSAWSLS